VNCDDLAQALRESPLEGWACAFERGHLRLLTPFRYPDGGLIELYVDDREGSLVVTDFGEAYRFLETNGIDPERSASRKQLIDLATRLGAAANVEGALEITVASPVEVFPAAMRLAQVITRVGDHVLFAKGAVGNTFSDTLEDFLRSALPSAEVRRGQVVQGRAAVHRVDIVVRSARGIGAIEGLSAITTTGANAQTAYTIQKFADIAALGSAAPDRFAVLDNSGEVWADSLRRQLEQFAYVVDWEHRDELVQALGRSSIG
jgi:hypothetical protein